MTVLRTNGPGRRVTIKDIAERLGISHATVSRALADHPHTSEATKARVQAVAAELGYIPHSAARVMRGVPSSLVGLIIPDIQNDFYATVAKALAESCNEAGFQLVLAITEDDPVTEVQHVRELAEARAAGVVIVPSRGIRRETAALLKALPVVQLIRRSPALATDWLGIDDGAGIAAAARHLLDLGHRRIAYVGGHKELSTGAARATGFRTALGERSKATPVIEVGPPRAAFGREAMVHILGTKRRPTAVVSGGARTTIGILEAIEAEGLSVPADLSLVGFGDPPWFRWWRSGITTLGLPVRDIAFAAGALLVRRIREAVPPDPPTRATYPAMLLTRGSTAPPGKAPR